MFCPRCGQEQISEETRFCSRCGFMLTMVSEIIANGGVLPQSLALQNAQVLSSPRKKGLKQGLFILLLALLFVPLIAILSRSGEFAALIGVLFSGAGLLRMAYAVLFQSNVPKLMIDSSLPIAKPNVSTRNLEADKLSPAVPQQPSIPVPAYVPPIAKKLNDTNNLAIQPPPSVTDHTTKLLQNSEK